MVQLADQLRSTISDDGAVVLNRARNQITILDAMGGYIWRRLEDGLSADDIVHRLAQETGEDPQIIRNDVSELLQDLRSRHLTVAPNTVTL
jgi:hypothetical protein